jgi:hypothetical protein
MPPPKNALSKLNEAQAKAVEAKRERIRLSLERAAAAAAGAAGKTAPIQATAPAPSPPALPERPWSQTKAGTAGLKYSTRAEPVVSVYPQPWTVALVNELLQAACDGKTVLCLLWPAQLRSVAPLHAMATLERVMARDLKGMRTLLYPGTHSTAAALQTLVIDRFAPSEMYRAMISVTQGNLRSEVNAATESQSFKGVLQALNDIRIHTPNVPPPSLAETIPSFVSVNGLWSMPVNKPLERSITKVARLAFRRQVREAVNAEWDDIRKAPNALLVMHGTSNKPLWNKSLQALVDASAPKPELLLLNATTAAQRSNYNAVRRIPEFLDHVRKRFYPAVGAALITDDPKTFFVLRARLAEMHIDFEAKTYAADATDILVSATPMPMDWKPELRSNSNFAISIVDRDAASVAATFQRLAIKVGGEDSPAHKALMDACLYVLRLSNLPAGVVDLIDAAAANELDTYSVQKNAWTEVEHSVRTVLTSGALNDVRQDIDRVMKKARELVDAWNDSTRMADRLVAAVARFSEKAKGRLALVLPSQKYILLAHRHLQRKLGAKWAIVESSLDWLTLANVGRTMDAEDVDSRSYIFVGVNADVLRILLAHRHVPHGTVVLLSYKHADSMLKTLHGMRELDALKAFRGRIGLLEQGLQKRLDEIPNPINVDRLGDMLFTFELEEPSVVDPAGEQSYYHFDLEGGRHAYSGGWVFRYEPDQDPVLQRSLASSVQQGDMIFDMSDELRGKVEAALQIGGGVNSVVYPERAFLKLYHDDVVRRTEAMFPAPSRTALARALHKRMIEIDAASKDCTESRLIYWLSVSEGDNRPHAPKDGNFFKTFCRALDINDQEMLNYWNFIKNARRLNQFLGRVLAAQYAEVLLRPESAVAYRKIPADVVKQLQQDALDCVFRVESIVTPQQRH